MPVVRIPCDSISDWDSFHTVFAQALGFPQFYGRNMNAWADCLESLDCPDDGMTNVHCAPPDVLTLPLDSAEHMPEELYRAVVDCAALVNWQRMEVGEPPVVAIAAHR